VKLIPKPIYLDGSIADLKEGEDPGDETIIHLDPIYVYFDMKTGLLQRMSLINDGPMGRVHVDIDMSDYMKVDGKVMLPRTVTMRMMQAVIEMRFAKYSLNVPIDDDVFKMPEPNKPRKTDTLGAMVFKVESDGLVQIAGKSIKPEKLTEWLKTLSKSLGGQKIPYAILRVDTKVPYEKLAKVLVPLQMNCGRLKIEKIEPKAGG
jgi:biopolymer transport protein ExbD